MSSTSIFDLQLYPCANGQCLHQSNSLSRTKVDLINYLTSSTINSTNENQESIITKMIDQNKSTTNVTTSDTNFYHNLSEPINRLTSSPVWIPIPSLGLTLRSESWVIPLLTLASINILLILLLESLVLFRVHRKTSKPPQLFLGQTLLLALFLTSLHGYFTLLSPTNFTCTLTSAGLGLGYSLIFGTLLVKSIFLLSLHSGTYLPLFYQFLLLFFIMSTQIILSIQGILSSGLWDKFKFWPTFEFFSSSSSVLSPSPSSTSSSILSSLAMSPESRISVTMNPIDDQSMSFKQTPSSISTYSLCSSLPTSDTYYYSLGYNILLLLLVSIISFRIRRHRENYREALFITISGLLSILVWISWITGYLVSRDSGSDAFSGFGLQINSLIVFLVMFTPKAKQLIKLSWVRGEGDSVEIEDEEEDEVDYCDEDCDTIRNSLGPAMVSMGGRNLGGGRRQKRRQRGRQGNNRGSGEIGNILCSAEYSGHDSNQSLCAQSFVHLNPNYLLPNRPVYQPLHQPPSIPLPPHHITRQTKSSQQIYSSNNNLLHHSFHPHHLYSPSPQPPPPVIIDSIRSHDVPWSYKKPSKSHNSVNNNHRFIYSNSLLKSFGDDAFAFYRIPPIKSIYLNNR